MRIAMVTMQYIVPYVIALKTTPRTTDAAALDRRIAVAYVKARKRSATQAMTVGKAKKVVSAALQEGGGGAETQAWSMKKKRPMLKSCTKRRSDSTRTVACGVTGAGGGVYGAGVVVVRLRAGDAEDVPVDDDGVVDDEEELGDEDADGAAKVEPEEDQPLLVVRPVGREHASAEQAEGQEPEDAGEEGCEQDALDELEVEGDSGPHAEHQRQEQRAHEHGEDRPNLGGRMGGEQRVHVLT
jgi:hypothetical protein